MTNIEIWNLALGEVGSLGTIENEADATPEAAHCRASWPQAFDNVLAAFPWSCARSEAQLVERADKKSVIWAHVFQLPQDCITIRDTVPARIRFAHGEGTIYTDEPEVSIVYTARISPERLPQHLAEAAALKLAQHLATAMRTGGGQLIQSLHQRYELAIGNARTIEVRATFSRPRSPRWRWA